MAASGTESEDAAFLSRAAPAGRTQSDKLEPSPPRSALAHLSPGD